MGEKHITIRMTFKAEPDAATKREIRRFFDECKECYDWWTHNRYAPDVRAYWDDVKRRWPLAYDFLAWRYNGGLNATNPATLSGQLSWAGASSRRRIEWRSIFFQYVSEVFSGAETVAPTAYLLLRYQPEGAYTYDLKYPRLNSPVAVWDRFHGRPARG